MIFRNKINKDDDYTVNLKDCLAKTEFIDGDTVKGMTVKEHCVLTGFSLHAQRCFYGTAIFAAGKRVFSACAEIVW